MNKINNIDSVKVLCFGLLAIVLIILGGVLFSIPKTKYIYINNTIEKPIYIPSQCGDCNCNKETNETKCIEEYLYKGEPKFDYTYGYWYKCLSKTCGELESSYPILLIKRNGIYQQATTVMGKTCEDAYYEEINNKLDCGNTTIRKINATDECVIRW